MSMKLLKIFRMLFTVLLKPRYLLNQVYLCWKNPKIPGKGKTSGFELKREELRFGKLTSKFPSDPIVRGTFFVIKKAYMK